MTRKARSANVVRRKAPSVLRESLAVEFLLKAQSSFVGFSELGDDCIGLFDVVCVGGKFSYLARCFAARR
jgi:hypothetical protein